ncbi:hypothetical protein WJX84_009015 [Apatococcus fuscideae]|uniref:60S ribosomal export protein NMD3 n=1 Tax=Apatococcus fuscideae TaxID=2026836 RepID=A0AAW1T4U6_9CHLO
MAAGIQGIQATFLPQHTQGQVLCCLCGMGIAPNPSNMCVNCIRSQVDITEPIQKKAAVMWCKECGRYLNPPRQWIVAQPESKELLTHCIKRLKGLSKVKLVDAGFIWTEPHSRRLKVKLTVQGEVLNGAILQESLVIEYIVETHMCPDCARVAANPNVWNACAQVRQHVPHKRTFFYLEQLILKFNADAQCLSMKEIHEGVDFYFSSKSHALKFVDFLQTVVPVRFRHDKQLVSHNEHQSTYNYKYTFSVEIVPICKDDLICLPQRVSAPMGSLGPIVLCTRVTGALHLLDLTTLRVAQVDANSYWRAPYTPMLGSRQLVEFVVLDIELLGPTHGKHALAEAQVVRASDFGSNDRTFFVKTHLGQLLHPGDTALGYDLSTANLVDPELERCVDKGMPLPDVVLVRKSYEEARRRQKKRGAKRAWKLKRINQAGVEDETPSEPSGPGKQRRRDDGGQRHDDMERFLQELEEDPEMRAKVALYKDGKYAAAMEQIANRNAMTEDGNEDDEDLPEVPLDELLDDMAGLQLEDSETADGMSEAPMAE